MKSSCISYPEDEPLVLIRTSQLSLCGGNHCAAALLSFFEYWHNMKLGHQQQAEHLNRVAEMHGEQGTQDTSLFQYHNETDIEAGLLHLYGRKMIRQALAILVEKAFVSIHQNPTQRYRFDKTHYFLFHPDEVRSQLLDIPHEVKMPHRQGEKASPCGTFTSPCGIFTSTIPEITPEITPEIETPPPLPPKGGSECPQEAGVILRTLNTLSGRTFASTTHIERCLRRGATTIQCLHVLFWWAHVKIVESPDMKRHFNNETPFRPEKFDKYRAEAEAWHEAGRPQVLPAGLVSDKTRASLETAARLSEEIRNGTARQSLFDAPGSQRRLPSGPLPHG